MGGTLISYIFITAHYEGMIWPGRLIGFSVGVITFSILTYMMMNEGINTKTLVSLILALGIILTQVFIK